MKINITIKNEDSVPQVFDSLYALIQSLNPTNYQSVVDIKFNAPYSCDDLNILYVRMPVEYVESELIKYDLIFISNESEPLTVTTKATAQMMLKENVYFLANSYLTNSHPLYHKVVWEPGIFRLCRDFWTRQFYPQLYENIRNQNLSRRHKLIAINGSNRANRHYFFSLLQEQLPSIARHSKISTTVQRLNDCQWESTEDTHFKNLVNTQYQDIAIPQPDFYYSQARTIGIDGKFGKVNPGFFIMPEYFEYSCVIFPESTWQNDELSPTEKALKCFYAGSLPFPIGGSNINRLYNDIGFYTAWNLLPENLKQFDQLKDHTLRYQQAIDAIKWLNSNTQVFDGEPFKQMIVQNRTNVLTGNADVISILGFYKVIQKKLTVDLFDKKY